MAQGCRDPREHAHVPRHERRRRILPEALIVDDALLLLILHHHLIFDDDGKKILNDQRTQPVHESVVSIKVSCVAISAGIVETLFV